MIWEIYLNKIQNSQCICIDTLRIESVLAKFRIQLIFGSVPDFLRCIYKVVSGKIEFSNNLLRHLADKFGTSFLQETRIIYIYFLLYEIFFFKCQKRVKNLHILEKKVLLKGCKPRRFHLCKVFYSPVQGLQMVLFF